MINGKRIEDVQRRMREKGIDAYLILTHDDYIYLLGEDRFQPRAILPAEGMPAIIAFKGEEGEIRDAVGADNIRLFGSLGEQMKDVINLMREIKGKRDRIRVGVQMWFHTPAFLLSMFSKANPFVDVVDIAPVMNDLRAIKDAEETSIMERAGEIADIGMEAAAKALAPGVTENEVAAEAEYAMRKVGGHGTATPVFVNSGPRSGWLHGTATDRKIGEGELVVIDLVPRYKGYCSNLCRTFVLGTPTDAQRKLFDTYRNARAAAIETLRPGVKMKEVDQAARKIVTAAGYGEYYVAGMSHGIGLNFEEAPAPTISPGDSAIEIREGMMLTAGHPVLSVPGTGGARIEDTFRITADGPVPLTRFNDRLEPG